MPPKAKAKGKIAAPPPIQAPKVTEKEVNEARRMLSDGQAKHRANSNMMYWLKTTGQRESYDAITPKERKDLFVQWFAWSMNPLEAKLQRFLGLYVAQLGQRPSGLALDRGGAAEDEALW